MNKWQITAQMMQNPRDHNIWYSPKQVIYENFEVRVNFHKTEFIYKTLHRKLLPQRLEGFVEGKTGHKKVFTSSLHP